MSQAINGLSTTRALPASAVPSAIAHGLWFIPIVDHPGRPDFVRFARYPRKARKTAAEAIAYAAKVIAWRAHFAAYKLQKRQAIFHPRHFAEAAE